MTTLQPLWLQGSTFPDGTHRVRFVHVCRYTRSCNSHIAYTLHQGLQSLPSSWGLHSIHPLSGVFRAHTLFPGSSELTLFLGSSEPTLYLGSSVHPTPGSSKGRSCYLLSQTSTSEVQMPPGRVSCRGRFQKRDICAFVNSSQSLEYTAQYFQTIE